LKEFGGVMFSVERHVDEREDDDREEQALFSLACSHLITRINELIGLSKRRMSSSFFLFHASGSYYNE
jgi:hypothetical protein